MRGRNGFYADGSDDYGAFNLGNNHGLGVAMGSNAQAVGGALKQRRFPGFLCTQGALVLPLKASTHLKIQMGLKGTQ